MSNQQVVQSKGIYHGLPVYPSSLKGLTAIITGANGISGNYMLRVLAQNPERWSKIYCLSRQPPALPDGLPKNAEHIALDFMKEPEEIAAVLKEKGVKADYIFFYSYVQAKPKAGGGLWSDAEEMCRVNLLLLKNFLLALPLTPITPTRIMLQTGAKNYGIHLGPAALPQEEHHPRITLEPNFYYPQEDFLFDFCAQHSIGWNVCMPAAILGAVPNAAMNLIYPLGIYSSICKSLSLPLSFPADLSAWETPRCLSSSMLNGYMEEWAVLTPHTANERFNTSDGAGFTWGGFWPKLAGWYGLEFERPVVGGGEGVYTEVRSRYDPPPRGFGPPGKYRYRFRLVDWARRPEVQAAWGELVDKHGLVGGKLQDMDVERIFGFADGSLLGAPLDLTMGKARKMGWCGFVDSCEAVGEVLGEFVGIGMLPPMGA